MLTANPSLTSFFGIIKDTVGGLIEFDCCMKHDLEKGIQLS